MYKCPTCGHESATPVYTGFVYVMAQDPAFIKIGFSKNPRARVASVAWSSTPGGSSHIIYLLATKPGNITNETALIKTVPSDGIWEGPWFFDTQKLRDFLKSEGFDIPTPAPNQQRLKRAERFIADYQKALLRLREESARKLKNWK